MRWPTWMYRLVPYLGRRQANEDLQEEPRLHLELEREHQRHAGVPPDEALRAARRRLGNEALIRERTRDVWGWRWLDDLGRDLRHAVRTLRRSPGFTAAVVIVLALGTGVATAMFGIVYGMLIRPLPYPDAGRIVRVGQEPRQMPGAPVYLSARAIEQVRQDAASFEQLAAYGAFTFEWIAPDGARPWGAPVSPELLRLLGARPHLGRLFTDDEARSGADGVVLLSHHAWTRRFDADPDVVGTVIDAYNEARTVVGVLAEGFYFPRPGAEVWIPYVLRPDAPTEAVLGRLREGVSAERAATEVGAILQRMDGAAGRGPDGGRQRARSLSPPGGRCPRDPGDSAAGRDGGRIPAGASGTGRGHPARAADRLRQRGGAAARARGDSPAGAGGPRGAGGGPGPDRAAAPDRERHARLGWRGAGAGDGRRRAARGAGADAERGDAARRGRPRRRRPRLHAWAVGGRRAAVRRGPGPPVVRAPSAPHPHGRERARHGRLRAASRQPDAGGAGGGAGGAGPGAAGGGGAAAAQLRRPRHPRPRLRPDQRDRGQHEVSHHRPRGLRDPGGVHRGRSGATALLRRARRGV